MQALVEELAAARIGRTFNQYAEGPRAALLRRRLGAYLEARIDAPLLLVGEAPGYRGARVSGIAFTSERQLTRSGPAEATATIVHRVLRELGIEEDVVLWNVVPTHPGTATSNRPPTRDEVAAGRTFVDMVAGGRRVIAVGRIASCALDAPFVRHPSHGGARRFRAGLLQLFDPRIPRATNQADPGWTIGSRDRAVESSPDGSGEDLDVREARTPLLSSWAGGQAAAVLSA